MKFSTSLIFIFAICSKSAIAQSDEEKFANDVSILIPASLEDVTLATTEFLDCAVKFPNGPLGAFKDLTLSTASFAVEEPLIGTKALLTDFTRQLIVQSSYGSECTALAKLWNDVDPFIRETVDRGIGLAESDLAAAEGLDALGKGIWDEPAQRDARARVLEQWDRFDGDEEQLNRVFLTRLSAWTPFVERVWDDLSDEGKLVASRITFDGHVPDPDSLRLIIGTDKAVEWVGGGNFSYGHPNIEAYSNVTNVALAGYFGGRNYAALVAQYKATIAAANSIMYSNTAFGTIFDLMDLNSSYLGD